jgi:hypothetical protein
MIPVRTVEDFQRKNEAELRSFFSYKTGIYDQEVHDETIQEFYVRLIESKALETFDPEKRNVGTEESCFNQYIINLFCWMLPVLRRRNPNANYQILSRIDVGDSVPKPIDIWELLNKNFEHTKYDIEPSYSSSALEMQQEEESRQQLEDFIEYIRRTEPEKKANRFELYLRRKMEGCKAADIALMLGVSNYMVTIIKQDIHQRFKTWIDDGQKSF